LGEDFAESGTQEKHHFANYERDGESGLDYAINRSHSKDLGRFQQADPYKPAGGGADPQSWNRYAYSRSNPIDFCDPSGLNLVNLGSISVSAGSDWISMSADSPGFALMWNSLFGGSGGSTAAGSDTSSGTTDPVVDKQAEQRKKEDKAAEKASELLKKKECGDYISSLIQKTSMVALDPGKGQIGPLTNRDFGLMPPIPTML